MTLEPKTPPDDIESYLDPVQLRRIVRGADKLKGVQPDLLQHWNGLDDEFKRAGLTPEIKSGYRTAERQNWLHTHGYPTKGNDGYKKISPHQEGRALDISFSKPQREKGRQIIADYARRNGLHVPSDEPWHVAILQSGQQQAPSVESYLDPVESYLDPPKSKQPKRSGLTFEQQRQQAQGGLGGGPQPARADVMRAEEQKPRTVQPKPFDARNVVRSTIMDYNPSDTPEAQAGHEVLAQEDTLAGNLKHGFDVFTDPVGTFTKSRGQRFEESIAARIEQQQRSQSPEVVASRKEFGAQPAPIRAMTQPAGRAGAGLVKTLAGVSNLAGLAPNRVSEYLNQRASVLEDAASLPPLNAQGEEIVRSLPEKATGAVLDIGFTVAQLIAMKKATGMSLSSLMAAETALKTSDKPLRERTTAVAHAYGMGKILDQHLSRPVSAALFGGPTAVQTGLEVAQGNMSLEDALLQTGVQTGAGAIMAGKKPTLAEAIPASRAREYAPTLTPSELGKRTALRGEGREADNRISTRSDMGVSVGDVGVAERTQAPMAVREGVTNEATVPVKTNIADSGARAADRLANTVDTPPIQRGVARETQTETQPPIEARVEGEKPAGAITTPSDQPRVGSRGNEAAVPIVVPERATGLDVANRGSGDASLPAKAGERTSMAELVEGVAAPKSGDANAPVTHASLQPRRQRGEGKGGFKKETRSQRDERRAKAGDIKAQISANARRQQVIESLARDEVPYRGWDKDFPDLAEARRAQVKGEIEPDGLLPVPESFPEGVSSDSAKADHLARQHPQGTATARDFQELFNRYYDKIVQPVKPETNTPLPAEPKSIRAPSTASATEVPSIRPQSQGAASPILVRETQPTEYSALLPIESANFARGFEKNIAGEGPYITDGKSLVMKGALPRSLAVKLSSTTNTQPVASSLMAKSLEKSVSEATQRAEVLGYQKQQGTGIHQMAFLRLGSGEYVGVDAARLRWMQKNTAADEIRGSAPHSPLVFYKNGKPVGVLQPVQMRSEDAEFLATLPKPPKALSAKPEGGQGKLSDASDKVLPLDLKSGNQSAANSALPENLSRKKVSETSENQERGTTQAKLIKSPEQIPLSAPAKLAKPSEQKSPSASATPPSVSEGAVKAASSPAPESFTSAKKAQVDIERAERGAEPLPWSPKSKSDVDLLESAKKANESNPDAPRRLVDEVLEKPRALSDQETVQLDLRKQELKNEHARLLQEVAEAKGADFESKAVRIAAIEQEFDATEQAWRLSGTEKGRGLRAQQVAINQDYDLLSMLGQFKAKTGKEPPLEVRKEIEGYQKRIADLEQRIVAQDIKPTIAKLQREVRREQRQVTRKVLDEEAAVIKQNIAAEFARLKSQQSSTHSLWGLGNLDPEGVIARESLKYVRNRVRAGVTDSAQMIDDVHGLLSEVVGAGVTRRQVAEMISGYNRPVERRSDLQRQIDQLKSDMYHELSEADIEAGVRSPRREGPTRGEARQVPMEGPRKSDARSSGVPLQGPKLSEGTGRKAGPRIEDAPFVGPRTSDANRLRAEGPRITDVPKAGPRETKPQIEKRYQTQIAELERRMAAGDFSQPQPRGKTVLDPETQKLADQLDATKNKYRNLVQRNEPGAAWRVASAMRKAWLLSWIKTHVRNIAGTGLYQPFDELSRPLAATVDAAVGLRFGGERTIQGLSPSASLDAILKGGKVGLSEGKEILKQGATREDMERHQYQEVDVGAIPGLNRLPQKGIDAINIAHNAVFRFMSASDRLFFRQAERRNLIDRATVQARNERKNDPAIDVKTRAKELESDPVIQADARADALISTFNNSNTVSDTVKMARSYLSKKLGAKQGAAANFAIDLFVPFDRTPTNVIARVLEASPAGFAKAATGGYKKSPIKVAKSIIDATMTQAERRQFAQAVGRAGTGTAIITMGMMLAPKVLEVDDRGNVFLKALGKRINVSTLSPVGNLLALGARLRHEYDRDSLTAGTAAKIAGRVPLDQPLLRGTSQIADTIRDPDRSAGKTAASLAFSAVPFSGIVRGVGETIDPAENRIADTSFKQQFQRNVPKWREELPSERKGAFAKRLIERMREGESVDLDEAERGEQITKSERKRIEHDLGMTPRQVVFSNAHPDVALSRFERMSENQRAEVAEIMSRKAYSLLNSDAITETQREEFRKRIETLGIEPVNSRQRHVTTPFSERLLEGRP